MNIAVVGPGALGTLFAALLGRAGHEVWLLDHDAKRAAVLAARGLWVEDEGPEGRIGVKAGTSPTEITAAELILLCVKSGAVDASLAGLSPYLAPSSLLIAFQNGIGHLESLRRRVPADRRTVAVTAQGATLVGPGRVRQGGRGPTRMGFLAPPAAPSRERALRAAATLTSAGIPTTLEEDISGAMWRKLLANAGINALTALHECPNGRLADDPHLQARLVEAVTEAAGIARALGVAVPDDPVGEVLAVCRATAGNLSSMLQDIRRRRPTEIDAINGAIVAEARRLGLAAPVNEALVRAVKVKEREFH